MEATFYIAALEAIRDGNVPRSRGKGWREDGQPSKHDRCIHGTWMYEDCTNCIADFISATISTTNSIQGEG